MLEYFKKFNSRLFYNVIAIPPLLRPTHFPGLDGLRGIAIIIVIASHIFLGTKYSDFFSGDAGVEIFFVISGFLITSLLLKEKITTGKISLRNFYLRRFLRIIPLAYLFIFVLVLLNFFLSLNISYKDFLSASLFYRNIPKLNTNNWFLAHFWSLSVEEQFYLTFPFLLVFDLNKYIKVTGIIIFFIPIIGFLGYTKTGVFFSNSIVHTATFVLINLLSKTVCILIGSLLSIMLFKGFFHYKSNFHSRYLSLLLLIFAILIHTENSIIKIPHCGLFLFPLLIGIIIILNLNETSILTKLLSNKIITYIGVISYSLYIWQQLFTSEQYRLFKQISLFENMVMLLAVVVTSYHLYEKPILRLKKCIKAPNG